MDLQDKIDAAFLAGFIVGTYDLKGESQPPEFIRAAIDRAMKPTSRTELKFDYSTLEAKISAGAAILQGDAIKFCEPVVGADFADKLPPEPILDQPKPKKSYARTEEHKQKLRENLARGRELKRQKQGISLQLTPVLESESGNV